MMLKKLILSFLIFIIPVGDILSQELYIMSPAAANIAKNRKRVNVFLSGNSSTGTYGTSHLAFIYGLTGKFTPMTKINISLNKKDKVFGDVEIGGRYRFLSYDKKNFHFRSSVFSHIRFPTLQTNTTNLKSFTSEVLPFQHSQENYSYNIGIVATQLLHKFAINLDAAYNINFPKGDYRYGNYFRGGLSFGYLLLPRVYESYDDVNLNLYLETKAYYFKKNEYKNAVLPNSGGKKAEVLMGAQLIFSSSMILEFGYIYSVSDKNLKNEKGMAFTGLRYFFF